MSSQRQNHTNIHCINVSCTSIILFMSFNVFVLKLDLISTQWWQRTQTTLPTTSQSHAQLPMVNLWLWFAGRSTAVLLLTTPLWRWGTPVIPMALPLWPAFSASPPTYRTRTGWPVWSSTQPCLTPPHMSQWGWRPSVSLPAHVHCILNGTLFPLECTTFDQEGWQDLGHIVDVYVCLYSTWHSHFCGQGFDMWC